MRLQRTQLGLFRSFNWPLIDIHIADFNKLGLILFANSLPGIGLENFFIEPSGSFIETITIKLYQITIRIQSHYANNLKLHQL